MVSTVMGTMGNISGDRSKDKSGDQNYD